MIPSRFRIFRLPVRFVCILLLGVFAIAAGAEELKIDAKLIWGTNDEKSPDSAHKPVDKAMTARLRKVFTWKNYFVVNSQNVTIPSRSTRQIKMSKQCTIEITELEGPKVEVKLIGDGKPVNKTVKALSKGECFTIAGDAKNESAWFVIITQVDPAAPAPDSNKPKGSESAVTNAKATNENSKTLVATNSKAIKTEGESPKGVPGAALKSVSSNLAETAAGK